MKERTAISGQGAICAGGDNIVELWQTLFDTKANWSTVHSALFDPYPDSPLFTVRNENILSLCESNFLNSLKTSSLDGLNRTLELALKATNEALNQAELRPADLMEKRIGIVLGTTVGCTFHNEHYYSEWKKGLVNDCEPVYTYLNSNLAERIQRLLGVSGPRTVITNACASGTDALGLAKMWLENGLCDLVIAGGCDEISRVACHGFSSLMLFSASPCTPFDVNRQGLNLGEGAGIMILEKESSVRKRGLQPFGYLRGYGTANDAFHPTAPHPDGHGLKLAIEAACSDAEITIDDIGYINAHGTATSTNDKAELTALYQAGITDNGSPTIVSTKGATGHTLGAAGAVEAVITLISLSKMTTPGTIGCLNQDPELPLKVNTMDEKVHIFSPIGMSTSLAFGGGNSALILEVTP